MALHYSNNAEKTACGRAATGSNATSNTQGVTCKTCLKAAEFITAASQCSSAPVVENEKVVEHRVATRAPVPAERKKGVAFTEWRAGLNANERSPRGKQHSNQGRGSRQHSSRAAA